MSTKEINTDAEIVLDLEKTRCHRERRPSVQFIDKNLIRRRSSCQDKSIQQHFQQSRLPSIIAHDELESTEVDSHQHDCENSFRSKI